MSNDREEKYLQFIHKIWHYVYHVLKIKTYKKNFLKKYLTVYKMTHRCLCTPTHMHILKEKDRNIPKCDEIYE